MPVEASYAEFGDPLSVLKLRETPSRPLAPGEARAKVLRAPINPSDVLQIAGLYGVRPPLPAVPGNEGLGRITELAGDVSGLSEGQLVILPPGGGTWRSECVARASGFAPLPEGDLDQLAMLSINPPTAALLLSESGDLGPGDWVVHSAANSAVGTYMIQLARARGLNLACVVRREGAVAPLKALGASVVMVDGPNLAERLHRETGAPMDLAIDAVGGKTLGHLVETLKDGGTLVSYGLMSGQPAVLQPGHLIFRDIRIRGFWLAKWFRESPPEARHALYGELIGMILQGTLHTPVDKVYPLEDIHDALERVQAGERGGKVLLAPNGI